MSDLEDDMDLAEDMLKYIINYVLENAPREMNFFNSFVDKACLKDFIMWRILILRASHIQRQLSFLRRTMTSLSIRYHGGAIFRQNTRDTLTEQIYKRPVS